MVDNLRLACGSLGAVGAPTLEEQDGWLATRSSLMDAGERRVVDQNSASWNRIAGWLQRIDELQRAA
jgi:hypothetical protein